MNQTCSSCKHWIQQPIDPQNVTAAPPGECRESLRAQAIVQMTPRGPQCLGWISGYPTVSGDNVACGRFELRLLAGK